MKKMKNPLELPIIWLSLIICAIAIATPILSQEQPKLEVVAELEVAPGNIAVGSERRIFLSLHQAYQPELKVVELPNDRWLY